MPTLPNAPTSIPAKLTAGDTWTWSRAFDLYTPADGWALKTYFRGAGTIDVVGSAAADGRSWDCTVAAETTAVLAAGVYTWTEFATYLTQRYQLGAGSVRVLPNPVLQVAGDARPFEEVVVANLEAFLKGSTEEGVLEFTIGGRAVKLMTPKEALSLLDDFRGRVSRLTLSRRRRPPIVPWFRPL